MNASRITRSFAARVGGWIVLKEARAPRRTCTMLACVVAVLVLAGTVVADDIVWDNDFGNNLWDQDENWVGDVQPGTGDDAIVGAPAPTIVQVLQQIANLEVLRSGEVQITTGTLELLEVAGGVQNDGVIRIIFGAVGAEQLVFNAPVGAPSTLDGSGEVVLAKSSTGTSDDATVRANSGTVTHGATHVIRGEGRLMGTWINNGEIRSEETTGDSSALLRLAPATITNNNLLRAANGSTLRLRGSAASVVQGPSGVILADDGGTIELDMLGLSTISNGTLETVGSGQFLVPLNGQPNLENVTNLGTINIRGNGKVYLKGASFTNDGLVTININSSGLTTYVSATSDMLLQGSGQIELRSLSGGGGSARLLVNTGVVLTNAEGHTIYGEGWIGGGGNIVNNGDILGPIEFRNTTLSGTGLLRQVAFVSDATHRPGGDATAIVPLQGLYFLIGGDNDVELHIDLGGETPGTGHDQLSSNGDVFLGGTLKINIRPGYSPTGGEQFTIITTSGGTIFGTFDAIDAEGEYTVQYNPTSVVLTLISPAPACDADLVTSKTFEPPGDGTVDAADLAFLLGEWGANPGSLADIVTSKTFQPPPDGIVDGADLAFLLGAWGPCS